MEGFMRVIVGCEFSQIVTIAFREKGHEAYSCDTAEEEGDRPEWHIQKDILEVLKREKFDLGIFHPPCTYLTVSANKWLKDQPLRKSGALVGRERREAREEAIVFFMKLVNAKIDKICIENPIGVMSSIYRKPDQIIQPYQFGHEASKSTCLWLKELPLLTPTNIVGRGEFITYKSGKRCTKWYADAAKYDAKTRTKIRNKTFQGIAEAMANTWG